MSYQLYHGDCLEVMPTIPDNSVDMILVDPPYGTTKCKWDVTLDLDKMWKLIQKIKTPSCPIVLFSTQPFTSVLISSRIQDFKYCWTWDKKRGVGHLVAKHRPMQRTEDICVFGSSKITYNPQMTEKSKPRLSKEYSRTEIMGGTQKNHKAKILTHSYPTTVLEYPWSPSKSFHPTQKPVDLLRYLIRTYTNRGDIVLDFCMGSGSTGVACMEEGRNFIGIEKDTEHGYFEIAQKRIQEAMDAPRTLAMKLE